MDIQKEKLQLIIENVRSLAGRHEPTVKPLTIVTGENSAGKTSFLSVFSIISDSSYFPLRPRFNAVPYNLGTFETIATVKAGKSGRSRSFTIGYKKSLTEDVKEVVATYIPRSGHSELSKLCVSKFGEKATLEWNSEEECYEVALEYKVKNKPKTLQFKLDIGALQKASADLTQAILISWMMEQRKRGATFNTGVELVEVLYRLFGSIASIKSTSVAPIRTKPRRTFDDYKETYSPEGEHVPFIMNLMQSENSNTANLLKNTLESFGVESKLFKKIEIKKLGKKSNSPIELSVVTSGRPMNLLDVGYGISQVLPIIVQSVLSEDDSWLLLQQPEVHLHPRAQAALGSMFVRLVKDHNKHLVIETHSDYILDRVRQEVAAGMLSPDEVQILFFEKTGADTRIHEIGLDKQGNIVNAPRCYKTFFLEEELRTLKRTGGV